MIHCSFFDSHSRNTNGYHDPNENAVLLKFCLISSPNNYIKTFSENNTSISLDTQYGDLQYISVEIVEQNKTVDVKRKYSYHRSYYGKT